MAWLVLCAGKWLSCQTTMKSSRPPRLRSCQWSPTCTSTCWWRTRWGEWSGPCPTPLSSCAVAEKSFQLIQNSKLKLELFIKKFHQLWNSGVNLYLPGDKRPWHLWGGSWRGSPGTSPWSRQLPWWSGLPPWSWLGEASCRAQKVRMFNILTNSIASTRE